MENNIITFNSNPMLQAIITNSKLLAPIRKQEEKAKQREQAAIQQLEAEKGKKYPENP